MFRWCKARLIVNVFAATYWDPEGITGPSTDRSLNIFAFNAFGSSDVIKVCNSAAYESFFPNLKYNFHQHQLRFGRKIEKNDQEFWSTVLRLMNASYIVVKNNYSLKAQYFSNGIDVIPLLYGQTEIDELNVYPLKIDPMVIIVPEALPYADYLAYLQIVTTNEFFGYALTSIAMVMMFLSVTRYIKQKNLLLIRSVVDVVNLLMNDNGSIKYQKLSPAEMFVIVPLTFAGFVFINGILSNLQSYFYKPVLQPQIKTIEDLYNSAVPIVCWHEYYQQLLIDELSVRTNFDDWDSKII